MNISYRPLSSGTCCIGDLSAQTFSKCLSIIQQCPSDNQVHIKNIGWINHALITKLYRYNDVIISTMTSQITSPTIVYSTVYSDAHQRKDQSSTSLAFVQGLHRWPVNSPHEGPVTRKKFLFNNVIMTVLKTHAVYISCIRTASLVSF